ncbi:CerR family C-terminal domain-containing protein [Ideonella paludis]|uniref:CerR family C-terminal domain-containing protein n=1 Tax=Ideonella paludis TaxID=1233411 RepID=A0ABS5E1X9_9BURK|nr:CerR family C-terminal domain-containing protein [Ideonella paludis]MBQ0937319.1 CerR family C-terminal domain-containing protein [Ideonella paludis]
MTDQHRPHTYEEGTRAPGRADGEATRERLLLTALRLFAQRGFSATSTREIAQAAGANVAAIAYHFGDKAGLYRAAFFEPLCEPQAQAEPPWLSHNMPLAEAFAHYFAVFVEPLRQGEASRLCVQLRMREMLEPTGLWAEEIANDIRPLHEALLVLLMRALELPQPDDDLQRLALCISALGVHLHVGRDVADAVAPQLHLGPEANTKWAQCLVWQAQAMVEAERVRRSTQPEDAPLKPRRVRAGARKP